MIDKLESIINSGEGISVEFKKCKTDLPKSVFETICSFLNRCGGNIFLGVGDDRTITGIEPSEIQKIKNNLVTALNNPQKIAPTVYLSINQVVIDDKTILHIYVPESSQVHNTNGKIYDRNEDGDFDVTGNTDAVAQMYIRKQREYTENTVFPYATADDLKTDLIERVRKMAVNREPHHPWENMVNDELLRSAGLYQRNMQTGKSGYTLACILLFGKDEAVLSALPHHKTDAIMRRVNLDRYDDRDDIRCNLIESYDRLMSFVEKHLDDKFYLEGDVRVNVRNKLFREIVANILIHREFSSAYPAKLIIGNNEVITENGNKAHGHGIINMDDFTPYPKNPIIAGVFKEIGWADELGSGIRNIKHYAKIYSNSIPEFIEGDVFKTIIKIKEKPIKADKKPIKADKNQQIIIEYLLANEFISNKVARESLDLAESTTKRILKKMCEQDILYSEGETKQRIYRLKK